MEKPQRVQRTTLYALLAQACQRASATKPHFAPVDEEDVRMALKRARTTWSAGVDDVPMAILKRVADCTAPHLAEITNTTAHEKVQPRRWKMAQIVRCGRKRGADGKSRHTGQSPSSRQSAGLSRKCYRCSY